MTSCKALSQKNIGCKLKCKKGHVYCNTHIKMCKSLADKYHSTCDLVWYNECNNSMSMHDINTLLIDLEKCRRLRCRFGIDCCEGFTNKGHLGAIVKVQEKIEKCISIRNKLVTKEIIKYWK